MGCGSCSTGSCSTSGCGGGCKSGGCNKLNAFDWFDGMQQPTQTEYNNVYEIRFKNTRKAFFRNSNGLSLITGDFVAVESDRGFDVGQISLGGVLAQLQMRKKRVRGGNDKIKKIYRRATKEDLEKLKLARSREHETLVRARDIVRKLNLDMKLSEVEYQGDNTKAIFYYIADQRVDFRELIKFFANEFRVRIEMKQIGLRFESALVGGIGSCGRELCCATWLSDFKTVSTAAARYQNLSLNPMKISGQCGRLKCCLNFELDSYLDALKDIPKVDRIETEMGWAFLQKTDIFKRTMWFSYASESSWIPMDADKVMEMAAMNKKGIRPASLHSLDAVIPDDEKEADFVDVVGQATLREDPKRKKKKKKKPGVGGQSANAGQSQERNPQARNDQGERRPPRDRGERRDQRGPRPEGEQRGPRPEGQRRDQRPPRPEGEQRGPRPEGQQRPPRPEGEQRGPRPEGQQRPPRPEGEQRGPRPEGQQGGGRNFRNIEKRSEGDRPKRDLDLGGELPPNLQNQGPRPEGEQRRSNNKNKRRNKPRSGDNPNAGEGGPRNNPPAES